MKKILIVDKNKESRLDLRTMLDEYAHDTRKKFVIYETDSGSEAVMMSDHEQFDMIFMDVEISEIDSAKATELIRVNNAKSIIIVVSGSEDLEVRSRILRSGAEDYIRKPFDRDLFYSRLDNYSALIESRRLHLSIHKGHNLYGDETYARTISYFIKEYDVLAEFWEYYLLETQETRTLTDACRRCNVGKSILNSHQASSRLSDTVRAIYDIALLSLKLNLTPHIWIEESNKNIYFTIEGLSQVNPDRIRAILNKIPELNTYKFENYKVTVATPREKIDICKIKLPNDIKTDVKPIKAAEASTVATLEEIAPSTVVAKVLAEKQIEHQVYYYMDEEDLEDIKENLSRLNTLLLMVGSGDIRYDEVEEIAYFLDRIGKSASIYSESYPIARALGELSSTIHNNVQTFIDKSSSLGLFCKTFGLDLTNWLQMIFYDGAPSVHFMDDTIISNAQMVGSMLCINKSQNKSVDMDDIFDF
jgi:CheY-like chemotaxis protein